MALTTVGRMRSDWRWRGRVVAASVLILSSCASSVGVTSGENDGFQETGLITGVELDVDGETRSYDAFVPDDLGDEAHPLVFLFHGAQSSTEFLTGERGRNAPYAVWRDLAEAEKFIVVYPQGLDGPLGGAGWNDCRLDASTNPSADDVGFVDALIDRFQGSHNVDASRIYASGTSNGGHMSLRFAIERSDVFAAVAPVAAAMPVEACGQPVNPVSVLFMNGTSDPLLPYEGGEIARGEGGRGTVLSTRESLASWVVHNRTESTPNVRQFDDLDDGDDSTVTSWTYANGVGGAEVVLYEIDGGGHLEPSIQEQYSRLIERPLGKQNHDIEMASEIWGFFRDKTQG